MPRATGRPASGVALPPERSRRTTQRHRPAQGDRSAVSPARGRSARCCRDDLRRLLPGGLGLSLLRAAFSSSAVQSPSRPRRAGSSRSRAGRCGSRPPGPGRALAQSADGAALNLENRLLEAVLGEPGSRTAGGGGQDLEDQGEVAGLGRQQACARARSWRRGRRRPRCRAGSRPPGRCGISVGGREGCRSRPRSPTGRRRRRRRRCRPRSWRRRGRPPGGWPGSPTLSIITRRSPDGSVSTTWRAGSFLVPAGAG